MPISGTNRQKLRYIGSSGRSKDTVYYSYKTEFWRAVKIKVGMLRDQILRWADVADLENAFLIHQLS